MFCGPLPYVVISGYIEKKCSAGAITQSSSPATERSSPQKLGSTRPAGGGCSLGTPMQLRTGHPPSWAVAPWPWPRSSPPFAAPHAACAPPPPCACACGRRRPAVRRVRRRGDAALADGRLKRGRWLPTAGWTGSRTAEADVAGGRGLRPPQTRQRRRPAAELTRRAPGEWSLFRLYPGRDPSDVPPAYQPSSPFLVWERSSRVPRSV